jgi:hypothetical protein
MRSAAINLNVVFALKRNVEGDGRREIIVRGLSYGWRLPKY